MSHSSVATDAQRRGAILRDLAWSNERAGRGLQWAQTIPLLTVIGLLIAVGLAALHHGDGLVGGASLRDKQIVWFILAIPAGLLTAAVPYRRWRLWACWMFLAGLVGLLAVYLFDARQGSQRWIPIGPLSLQPSEFMKLAYILALADYLLYRTSHRRLWGLIPPTVLTLVPVLLILKEPDLGTSLVFLPVFAAVSYAAGARVRHFVLAAVVAIALSPVLWMNMSSEQRSRVTSVFSQRDGGQVPTGDGYQLHLSKQYLAFGGWLGREVDGVTVDDPAALKLPASRTDFIFCLVGDRFGLVGTLGTLGLYVVLVAEIGRIASRTQDGFGRLVAVGVAALLAVQVTINAGMTVGLMPITGLTLPLLSYGGSSLVSTAIALGLVGSIALRPQFDVAGEPFLFDDDEA